MLLDRAATDWLNTKPVFYNEKTGAISHNMNEVIDYSDFSFNAEGLRNYLKFGYTAYGQTMVQNVKALDHSSQIIKNHDGTLTISSEEDVAKNLWNPGQTNGTEVFEEIVCATKEWASKGGKTNIILPLSGGLDSRLLAYSVRDNSNIRAYSYGLSADQSSSFEVVKAKQVANGCNISWEQIELDSFLKEEYIDEWYCLYGPSTHLHGMYQIEFYKKIIDRLGSANKLAMLSGIIGDGWAGTVRIPSINSVSDLAFLGYTHGMSVDEDICLLKGTNECEELFYERHSQELVDENWRIVYAMRFKMMLLNYLLKTPNSYGMDTWSPFLDPKIAMDILNLDWTLKEGRKWQHEEFAKRNLNIGWEKDKCDYNIVIDIETFRKNGLRKLDEKLLSRVISKEYVAEVNKQVSRRPLRTIPAKPKTIQNLYNKGVKSYNKKIDEAIVRYEILGSIEKLMLTVEKYNE